MHNLISKRNQREIRTVLIEALEELKTELDIIKNSKNDIGVTIEHIINDYKNIILSEPDFFKHLNYLNNLNENELDRLLIKTILHLKIQHMKTLTSYDKFCIALFVSSMLILIGVLIYAIV